VIEWLDKINSADSLEVLENLRIETLGKKGIITAQFAKMKDIPGPEKKDFAANLNKQKTEITEALENKKSILEKEALEAKLKEEKIDVTKFNNEPTC